MKRFGNLWKHICSNENIEKAYIGVLKGKKINKERQYLIDHKQKLLKELTQSLLNESYKLGKLKSFKIYEHKERVIHHPNVYPDKLLHHCVMNVIQPLILQKMTSDTYGSLKGRGITMAIKKLKKSLTNKQDWYYLQIDCNKFYENINHDICKTQIRKIIKCKKTLKLIDAIIDSHNPGLAIGVYPSQYLANVVLMTFDHYVKEQLKIKYYFRYMDDMVFLIPNKQEAHTLLNNITVELNKLKLSIKNNIRISPVNKGINFIGYIVYPTHIRLRKRIKERFKRRVKKLTKNKSDDFVFKTKTASYYGWCKHANCKHLLKTILKDRIYIYMKRISEIKQQEYGWFGLSPSSRLSILDLLNNDMIICDYTFGQFNGQNKIVVKFKFDNDNQYHYFITSATALKEDIPTVLNRNLQDGEEKEFIGKIVEITDQKTKKKFYRMI